MARSGEGLWVKLLVPHIPHQLCCQPQRWDFQGEQGCGHRILPLLPPNRSQKEEGIVCISLCATPGFGARDSAALGLIPARTGVPLTLRVTSHPSASSPLLCSIFLTSFSFLTSLSFLSSLIFLTPALLFLTSLSFFISLIFLILALLLLTSLSFLTLALPV